MEYRTLGKTGLQISVLSYGASPLGGVFRQVDEKTGIRAVHTALDFGINFIDVAPYYGLTKAEKLLGKALKSIDRDRYYLATKVGRYTDELFDFSPKCIRNSVEASLKRLGVETIDLIQCHDIEFVSLEQIVNESLPALRKLQKQGKVRFIGITGLPLQVFRTVLDQVEIDTVLSYCHYSLNDTSLENSLLYLQMKQVGIINAAPLGMGLLTDHGTPTWHPAPSEIKRICAQVANYCRQKGSNVSKLAIQFSVANPIITTTLIGTADPIHVRDNVKSLEEPIDEDLLKEVKSILAPIQNMSWASGLIENN